MPQRRQRECPSIGIVVLNWNGYEDTSECIDNLLGIEYENYSIIVVDNGSNDSSGYKLKEDYNQQCKFVFNDSNLGFSVGVNTGIEEDMIQHDYFLILNNDVFLSPKSLRKMVKTAESSDKIGIVGPKLVRYDKNTIQSAGREYITFDNIHEGRKSRSLTGELKVGGVIGACMLIKSDLINDIGLLDEDFFFGGEDEEYCLRAISNGWEIYIQADAVAQHKAHSSSNIAFRRYHNTKGQLLLWSKRHEYTYRDKIWRILYDVLRIFYFTFDQRKGSYKSLLAAYFDVYVGETDKKRLELLDT